MKSQRIADALDWFADRLVRLARCIEELSSRIEPRAPFKPVSMIEAQRAMNEAYAKTVYEMDGKPYPPEVSRAAEAYRQFRDRQSATTNSQQD